MFDLSLMEIAVVLGVGVIAVGPRELPKVLRLAGRGLKQLRNLAGEFRAQLELMAEDDDPESLKQSQQEIESDLEFIESSDGTRYPAHDISDLMEEERAKRHSKPVGSAGGTGAA